MTEIKLTSEITVENIQHIGSDEMIARAAWVSTGKDQMTPSGEPIDPDKVALTLNYLMKHRHGTPFEHGSLTVRVNAPIKVWREWHRHRVGWSYNETSGRYKQLEPVFYKPPRGRPMIRPDKFKSANPSFEIASDQQYKDCMN